VAAEEDQKDFSDVLCFCGQFWWQVLVARRREKAKRFQGDQMLKWFFSFQKRTKENAVSARLFLSFFLFY